MFCDFSKTTVSKEAALIAYCTMITVPKLTLNNGVTIPTIGIGPGSIGFVNKPITPNHTWRKRVEKKLINKIKYEIAKHKYINSVTHALTIGYRLLDYSFAYGSGKEIMKSIEKSGLKREDIFITSRVSNKQQFEGTVREEFFRGMERMGLEYVDMFMFHWPVTDHFVDTYKEMEKLYKEGYVKVLGVANCHQHHLQAILDHCEITPAIDQFEVHPLFTQKALIEFCRSKGIAVQAYTPLARNDDRLTKNLILQGLAKKYGKTIQQIILRWDIQLGLIPIPRSLNAKRQFQNIDIFDFELTDEEIKAVDSININSRLRFDPDNLDFHSIG